MSPNTRGFSANKKSQNILVVITLFDLLKAPLEVQFSPLHLWDTQSSCWPRSAVARLLSDLNNTIRHRQGEKCVKSSYVVTTCLNAPPDKIIEQFSVWKQFIKEPSNALKNALKCQLISYEHPCNLFNNVKLQAHTVQWCKNTSLKILPIYGWQNV